MQKSEQINELATALAKAQGQLGKAKTDSVNPHFKSHYADLESVWDACRIPLSSNGLSITQIVSGQNLTTLLLHSSGQFISSEHPILVRDASPQAFGSGLSYARRYSLAALVGITQGDDDGNAAQGKSIPPDQAPKPQAAKPAPVAKSKEDDLPDVTRPSKPATAPVVSPKEANACLSAKDKPLAIDHTLANWEVPMASKDLGGKKLGAIHKDYLHSFYAEKTHYFAEIKKPVPGIWITILDNVKKYLMETAK
jgi:hypothetical protein